MRVWIDQDLCVGNGICEKICLDVFYLDGDVAYIREGERLLPRGQSGTLNVPASFEAAVKDAADECPAACIYLDI